MVVRRLLLQNAKRANRMACRGRLGKQAVVEDVLDRDVAGDGSQGEGCANSWGVESDEPSKMQRGFEDYGRSEEIEEREY